MRRSDREITDINTILEIVNKAKILHLGLLDNEYPYVVPLHYGYKYADETLVFYMHGAKEGHKTDLIRKNPNVCIELECGIELLSGGDNPCKYGAAFASVIGRGNAVIMSSENEKIKGLELLMENQTGRRFSIDGKMAASVEVIKVLIPDFTAKSRSKNNLDFVHFD